MTRRADTALPGPPDPWAPSEMPPFRSRPPYVMTEMIAAEPALAERLLHRLESDPAVEDVADLVRAASRAGRPVLVTGCGTSEHAAIGIATILTDALDATPGRDVRAVETFELIRRPPADGVVLGVSHEGGTRLTNEALGAARAAGAATALITVGGGSPGAEVAAHVIQTGEQDQSWCHTVGYLSPLVVGVALAARLTGMRIDAPALRAYLDVADDPHAAADAAAGLATADRIIVAASGVDAAAARELGLKVAEGARLPATSGEVEGLLHGHLAAATRWTGLVLIQTDVARAAPLMAERTTKLLAAARALGVATAAIVGPRAATEIAPDDTPAGRLVLPQPGRIPPLAAALLGSGVALQLLTERLARARRVNPDTLGREDPAQAAAHA